MNSFASPHTLTALPLRPPVEDLYARVFDAILEQRISATCRFTEDSLALMFEVRRSDIRSVLTQLSHQQVIILRSNHRPRVAALDIEQIRQMLHARRLTEITLMRLVCQRARTQDLQPLHWLVESERECTARGAAIRLSGEFHLRLADLAGNAPLAHFLGSLVPLSALAIVQAGVRTHDYCVWQIHHEILQALAHGNTEIAVAALTRHLDQLEEALLHAGSVVSQNRVAG